MQATYTSTTKEDFGMTFDSKQYPNTVSPKGLIETRNHDETLTQQPLTQRESQVAGLAQLSNKVIAHVLEISENTVQTHMKAARRKTRTANRTELNARVFQQRNA